jgi:tetratricopeptide (TPR) repeat protein
VRLLEEGLRQEPTNGRYMFYLAQSYHCLRRWEDARKMYKKRIIAGGWDEEIWYSHYMVAKCWLELKNIPKFEEWMQRAIALRPSRAEAYYQLTKHFREHSRAFQGLSIHDGGSKCSTESGMFCFSRRMYTSISLTTRLRFSTTMYSLTARRGCEPVWTTCSKSDFNRGNVIFNFQFYVQPVWSKQTDLLAKAKAVRGLRANRHFRLRLSDGERSVYQLLDGGRITRLLPDSPC